jgi:DNA repair protein RecO (recombination protein O)
MPLHESDSIILKTYPLAEADRIVVFFSRDFGKLRGVANGVRKPGSRFGASLEPLAHTRVQFFRKEASELVRIRSTDLIDSPMKLFEDYDRALLASHVAELVDRFLPDHEVQDPVFRLFCLVRTCMVAGATRDDVVRCYFEVWMLRLAGVLPDLFTCSRCRRRLDGREARVLLPGLTRTACAACAGAEGTEIPEATLEALDWILRTSLDAGAPAFGGNGREGLEHMRQLNRLWMERYFER